MNKIRTKISVATTFFLLLAFQARAQTYTVSGYISDGLNCEILIGAVAAETRSGKGAITNSYGFYSLTLPKGSVSVRYSFLGYEPVELSFELVRDTTLNISLDAMRGMLNEVVVTAGNGNVDNVRPGTVRVPVSRIRNVPVLLGESDLMKSIQYIPGVQNTAEGKSDLSIRGGSPDQNLILLDGNPIYNANHVFGFLSVFNTDALKNVMLYKSGFPARFGGRLSSVIDINTKDGDKERFGGSATLGLLAFKFSIEGPIIKDRTSFTFSARRSYADLFVGRLQEWLDEDNNSSTNFYFYDLNAKLHHKFNGQTSLYVMAYNGRDRLKNTVKENGIPDEVTNSTTEQNWKWGNTILAARLNSSLSNRLFMNGNLSYNRYLYDTSIDKRYDFTGEDEKLQRGGSRLDYDSGIRDYTASLEFEYIPVPAHYVRSGVQYICHDFRPEALRRSQEEGGGQSRNINAHEVSVYAEDDWAITRRLKINGGLRFSAFGVNGKTYAAVDPRFSARYLLSDRMSVKAGYTRMQQYIHLLSNNSLLLQTDLWVPTTERIGPMNSTQYSLGFYASLSNFFDIAVEGYYKDMNNVIEYVDGASFSGSSGGWEDKVEAGAGRSYGVEFSLEKRAGRTTGTVSYVWSKTERRFDRINYGEWFPARFDRRHSVNISLTHKLSEKIDMTAMWTFASGDMMTVPMMSAVVPEIPDDMGEYGDLSQLDHRNNYRMPSYHRLDVGMNYTPRKNRTRGYGVWNFSIYNVYNRMNPFKMYVQTEVYKNAAGRNVYTRKLKQITMFPIIPSISYTYNF